MLARSECWCRPVRSGDSHRRPPRAELPAGGPVQERRQLLHAGKAGGDWHLLTAAVGGAVLAGQYTLFSSSSSSRGRSGGGSRGSRGSSGSSSSMSRRLALLRSPCPTHGAPPAVFCAAVRSRGLPGHYFLHGPAGRDGKVRSEERGGQPGHARYLLLSWEGGGGGLAMQRLVAVAACLVHRANPHAATPCAARRTTRLKPAAACRAPIINHPPAAHTLCPARYTTRVEADTPASTHTFASPSHALCPAAPPGTPPALRPTRPATLCCSPTAT